MDMILFVYFMLHVCTLCNFLSQKGRLEFSFFILESVNNKTMIIVYLDLDFISIHDEPVVHDPG